MTLKLAQAFGALLALVSLWGGTQALAQDPLYHCRVRGQIRDSLGIFFSVDQRDIPVVVNGGPVEFGRQRQPQNRFDLHPHTLPWTLNLEIQTPIGGAARLFLTLHGPQTTTVGGGDVLLGVSQAEPGTALIGLKSFVGGESEAECQFQPRP